MFLHCPQCVTVCAWHPIQGSSYTVHCPRFNVIPYWIGTTGKWISAGSTEPPTEYVTTASYQRFVRVVFSVPC